jgi:hypothetical protein
MPIGAIAIGCSTVQHIYLDCLLTLEHEAVKVEKTTPAVGFAL